MLKLGVVGLRGLPGVMGGVESHAEELYPRVARRLPGLTINVVMRKPYVDAARREWGSLCLWPVWAPTNKYLEAAVHTVLALVFVRFRLRCDVVHIHAVGPGMFVPLAKILGMRVVFTHHGQDYDRAKWSFPAKMALRLGEWLAVRFSDEVISVSEHLADGLRSRFRSRAERISFIPNGASPTFSEASRVLDPEVLRAIGVQEGEYLLAVGRLVPEKGFDDLIQAHAAVTGGQKLVIVGKADHADAYSRSLLSKANDRVIFAGFQSHDSLRSLYAGASLFVLPSHHEGLPITALEALAMNTPTLLSDIPANKELALSPGHYFPTKDIAALASRLGEPHHNFAVDGDAIRGRYDWDKIATQTAAIIDRLRR